MIRYEGHAIVSVDGMIADGSGEMPEGVRNERDWTLFQAALDRAELVVLGRKGHIRHPNPGRKRLVLTHMVSGLERAEGPAFWWNPADISIEDVLERLGIVDGTIAVTGGTGTFDLFAPKLDAFALAEVHGFALPGGTPCFSEGHPRTVLAANGLLPGDMVGIDRGVTLTYWRR